MTTTAQRAATAGSLYHIEIRDAHYLSVGSGKLGRGYRAVILWGEEKEPAWSSGAIYQDTAGTNGRRMRLEANVKKGELERYFLNHGRRWEVERRAERDRKEREWKADTERRQALTYDRVPIYDVLHDLAEVVETALNAGLLLSVDGVRPDVPALDAARRLLDKHAQAVASIKASRKA